MNRYPGALATGQGGLGIELRQDSGASIPSFDADNAAVPEIAKSLPEFAIEKLHSAFFDWHVSSFVRQIELFEERLESPVQLIYRVRDPRQVMISMWQCQQRDPAWYSTLAPEQVPDFVARSFDPLTELSRIRPGLVVDYQDQCDRPIATLIGIFVWLWPATTSEQHAGIATSARHLTDIELSRSRVPTPFFGTESSAQTSDEIERCLDGGRDAVDRCYSSHEELLGLARNKHNRYRNADELELVGNDEAAKEHGSKRTDTPIRERRQAAD